VNHWWRNRQRMRLIQRGGRWLIEGPDSQRARVAWATLQDGAVRFTLDTPESASWALPAKPAAPPPAAASVSIPHV
jgi:hypothetical protein